MSSSQVMKQCKSCGKLTLHVQPSTSHVLHLLLSIITVGIWVPIWIIVAMNNGTEAQCTVCGRKKGIFG